MNKPLEDSSWTPAICMECFNPIYNDMEIKYNGGEYCKHCIDKVREEYRKAKARRKRLFNKEEITMDSDWMAGEDLT